MFKSHEHNAEKVMTERYVLQPLEIWWSSNIWK